MGEQRQPGFTLIELSIVLVIIGLIAGGILVGRDLIHAADIHKSISMMTQYGTAVRTFQVKYNCLPGDCPNATTFGFTCNGNGNGQIFEALSPQSGGCDLGTGVLPGEIIYAGTHMSQANLLQGQTNNWFYSFVAPYIPLGANLLLATSSTGQATPTGFLGMWITNLGSSLYGNFNPIPTMCEYNYFCQSLTAADAYAIDSKIDDGLPTTGKFYSNSDFVYLMNTGSGSGVHYAGAGGSTASVCINNSVTPNAYNVQNVVDKVCLPFFNLQ